MITVQLQLALIGARCDKCLGHEAITKNGYLGKGSNNGRCKLTTITTTSVG
jgi:hypothetical protein